MNMTEDQIETGRYYAKILLDRFGDNEIPRWQRFACMGWLRATKKGKPNEKTAKKFFEVYTSQFDFNGEYDVIE